MDMMPMIVFRAVKQWSRSLDAAYTNQHQVLVKVTIIYAAVAACYLESRQSKLDVQVMMSPNQVATRGTLFQ
jgi:hypothetical protein